MTDTTTDDIDELREKRRRELVESAETAKTAETPDEPVYANGADELDQVVADNDVVLVDFYADWCGPCQMLEPTLESIAAETNAVVAKVDIDANQNLAAEYGVRGVPNVVAFVNGEPTERVVGVRDRSVYANIVAEAGA